MKKTRHACIVALSLFAALVAPLNAGAQSAESVLIDDSDFLQALSPETHRGVLLRQEGRDNIMMVGQAGLQPGIIELTQQGQQNYAAASQYAISQANHLDLFQAGTENLSFTVQAGESNTASIEQSGADNRSLVQQIGNDNSLVHQQMGDGLAMAVTQFGGASAIIIQSPF
jgi:hypothetical protein